MVVTPLGVFSPQVTLEAPSTAHIPQFLSTVPRGQSKCFDSFFNLISKVSHDIKAECFECLPLRSDNEIVGESSTGFQPF